MRKVISILIVLLGIVATGCEYEVPLAEKQGLPIDNSVLGLWEEITPERKPIPKSRMKISRYSETEYLVRYFGGKESLYFRGYPIKIAGVSCVQIQWFRTWEESIGQEKGGGGFLVISYEVLYGDLVIKVFNTGVVSNKVKSSSELQAAFLRQKVNKDLFIDAGRFRRVNLNAPKQEKLGDAFRDAALKGDVATVRNLLAKGEDPNAQDKSGYTPLMLAAGAGHLPVVQALLAKGADPNAQDESGWTPLMLAAREGHLPVVQTLLANGANPNVKNKDGATALMYAAEDGHTSVVQALLAKGADVNAKTEKGSTALDFASRKGHTAVVEVLRKAMNKRQ